jgi:polar amino acid transport system substrate-binding protein
MKCSVAVLAGLLFLLSWSASRAAAMSRDPNTDAAFFKAVLAAASVPTTAHEAGTPALQPTAKTPAVVAGHSIFNDNCEHCHGPDAVEGIEERNLRHVGLRYGNKMDQVFMYTVTHGRPSKGMPNWSGILTHAQFRDILAYLHSIQEH